MTRGGLWGLVAACLLAPTLSRAPGPPRALLVSFEGLRWDYVDRAPTPNLHEIVRSGVHVKEVRHAFATTTTTSPSPPSLVTGLPPESHGVVADPLLKAASSVDPGWLPSQLQGPRSGAAMWPGAGGNRPGPFPTHCMPYNASVPFQERVAQLLEWFTSEEPINLGLLSWEQPGEMGRILGPENPLMTAVIGDVDHKLGYLVSELKRANLWDTTNVIITSHRGMAQSSKDRVIELDLYLDRSLYRMVDHSPDVALLPEEGKFDEVYKALANVHPHMSVYKEEDLPSRLHYQHNPRIQPILAVADDGWEILQNKSEFVLGNHGYDNLQPDMHPIFIAHGPAFRKNLTKQDMNSTDLYPLLCYLLDISPLPNNGSLDNVKDLLVSAVPEEPQYRNQQQESYAWFIGVFLGSILVFVFLLVFIKHLTRSQMPARWAQNAEIVEPLLQA